MKEQVRVGVGGFASDVGKTSLMCNLLRSFPSWEAIKTTRGHYRSCGKDPKACCVSHLLANEPVIFSGRKDTYDSVKDTGRYWDAGASNVHWVITTDRQVKAGIRQALDRVTAPGVFIEGNSFSEYVDIDFFIMVARPAAGTIKSSARRALKKASAIYLSEAGNPEGFSSELSEKLGGIAPVRCYSADELPKLVAQIRKLSGTSEYQQ